MFGVDRDGRRVSRCRAKRERSFIGPLGEAVAKSIRTAVAAKLATTLTTRQMAEVFGFSEAHIRQLLADASVDDRLGLLLEAG